MSVLPPTIDVGVVGVGFSQDAARGSAIHASIRGDAAEVRDLRKNVADAVHVYDDARRAR